MHCVDSRNCQHMCLHFIHYIFQNISDQHVGVHVCIQRARIPLSDYGITCHEDNTLTLNATDLETGVIYFPYPEPGSWYLAMMAYCYNDAGWVNISRPNSRHHFLPLIPVYYPYNEPGSWYLTLMAYCYNDEGWDYFPTLYLFSYYYFPHYMLYFTYSCYCFPCLKSW